MTVSPLSVNTFSVNWLWLHRMTTLATAGKYIATVKCWIPSLSLFTNEAGRLCTICSGLSTGFLGDVFSILNSYV